MSEGPAIKVPPFVINRYRKESETEEVTYFSGKAVSETDC